MNLNEMEQLGTVMRSIPFGSHDRQDIFFVVLDLSARLRKIRLGMIRNQAGPSGVYEGP